VGHAAARVGSQPLNGVFRGALLAVPRAEDLGVVRRLGDFVAEEHFLIQLLAGAATGELDLDVVAFAETGETDHVAREVDDAHRLAHVEQEHFPALAEGAGLQHELHGFGDGHEVATHLGVGGIDKKDGFDLTDELWHDAAAAAEDVAEPHRDEIAVVLDRGLMHDVLGYALGGAHDVAGADGLVGRDEDEVLGAAGDGGGDDVAGAEDVVGDRFDDVLLHEGNVLVRGGVEDGEGPIGSEDAPDAIGVADVGDDLDELAEVAQLAKLLRDLEDGIFAMAEQHESRGLEGDELPAELAADRAARSGHEHRLASGHRRDRREIGLDWIAAEQVFDLDFANGADADAIGEDLEQAGHGARLETRGVGGAHHFTNDGARGAGHGDDELFGAPLPVDALEVSKPAEHGDAGELEPVLGAVVVDEADRFDAELGVGEELLENHFASGAGPGDEGAANVAPASTLRPSAPAGHTRKEARGGEDEDGKEAVAEEDAERNARGREVAREYYKT